MKNYVIFTDGSCNYQTKEGGSGVYMCKPKEKRIRVGFCPTRTGRTEVNALSIALSQIPKKEKTKVTIYSDSQYVVNSIMKNWAERWQKEGWVGRKNVDLWKKILKQIKNRPNMRLSVIHIKGHQKDMTNPLVLGNSIADELANYKTQESYIETDPKEWDKI